MPNSAEHRAKYEANRQLLDTGNNGAPLSTLDNFWAATVAFYAALHLVDRLAARVSYHPANHNHRMNFITRHHRALVRNFTVLRAASEIARYGTINQFTQAYSGTTVQDILINQRLVAIETYVDNIFNPPAPPSTGAAGS